VTGGGCRGGAAVAPPDVKKEEDDKIPTPQKPMKRRRFGRRKICKFCADKVDLVDYKDVRRLRSFVTERGKIIPRRISGSCARHQRQLTHAIKRARTVAVLPYVATD
jgi:small subunit ribosomal protein S18